MKYEWLDEYLLNKRGVTKDLQKDWNWLRYNIGGKMFAALCLEHQSNIPYYITLKSEPEEGIFLREQYEDICFGDLDYLEGTCLDIFAQAIRAGYSGHRATQGREGFEKFDIVKRWDEGLYMETLRELTWR